MADISNEIKNFREAVYGEEVRGSMISLAEKLNEVSEATEAAEKKRVTAENGRVSAETKRQTDTAEAIKKNNAATERANTAASAAETATEETNRATENANAKASLANTAAGKAETAAKSANDAAGSVEAAKNAALEAAELATAEAGKATTAASNANSKASAANTAAEKANTAADRAEKAAEHAEGLVLGDISEKTVTFEMASQRAGVESGDSLAVAFGKLAKYCADLKPHVFVDPVNNLLGTDPKLPLSATQGKALDEKIEGVKADVTKLNGDYKVKNITVTNLHPKIANKDEAFRAKHRSGIVEIESIMKLPAGTYSNSDTLGTIKPAPLHTVRMNCVTKEDSIFTVNIYAGTGSIKFNSTQIETTRDLFFIGQAAYIAEA